MSLTYLYMNMSRFVFRFFIMITILFFMVMILNLFPSIQQPRDEFLSLQKQHFQTQTEKYISKKQKIYTTQKTSCSDPISKVGFIKTHKTASSSVQNILLRYGMNSGWNFVFPARGNHLNNPLHGSKLIESFNGDWLKGVLWKPMTDQDGYNLFALHTKWSQKEVEKLLGQNAKYITILRDPVDNFESLYNYAHFSDTFKMNLEDFVHSYIEKNSTIPRIKKYLGRNQQLYDLGLLLKDMINIDAIRDKIQEIDKNFDLVMIAEDFDASLVFLSEELCWPLANMTSLKVNARKESAVEKLSQKARDILQDWLWADQMLYDHFKEKLEKRKQLYGPNKLENEIKQLVKYNENVEKYCVEKIVSNNTKKLGEDFVPFSKDIVGFEINVKEHPYCKYYGISENQYIDELRQIQISRFRQWGKSPSN